MMNLCSCLLISSLQEFFSCEHINFVLHMLAQKQLYPNKSFVLGDFFIRSQEEVTS